MPLTKCELLGLYTGDRYPEFGTGVSVPFVTGVLSNGETLFNAVKGRPVVIHVITSFVSNVGMFQPRCLLSCDSGAAVKQVLVVRLLFGEYRQSLCYDAAQE